MEPLQNINTYQEFKVAIDREVYNQAEGFVRLGYLLRRAEDTDILSGSGYRTVAEFAKAEYGLTETYVSRYIAINKRYSEGGYSDHLQERFGGFGLAKLADMLTLPDGIVEVIPAEATRAEIQEIKKEYAAEQKISDLEMFAEQQEEGKNTEGQNKGQQEDSLLYKTLKAYYHENPEEYREVHRADLSGELWKRNLMEAMAPAGTAVKMARVAGTGRMMITIRGEGQNPELLNIRNGSKGTYTWEDLKAALSAMGKTGNISKDWEETYGEPYPEDQAPETPKRKTAPVVSIAKPVKKEKPAGKEKVAEVEPERKMQQAEEPERTAETQQEKKSEGAERSQQEKEQPENQLPKLEEGPPDQAMHLPEEEKTEIAPVQEEIPHPEPETEKEEPPGQQAAPEILPEEPRTRMEESGESQVNTGALVIDGEFREVKEPEAEISEDAEPEDGRITELLKEAEEYLETIREALKKRYYAMAKANAKHLQETLENLCRESDRKPMKGQHEISEYIKE